MAVPFWLWMFAHIILASASTASSKMSAKHQENDTPVKASHLLLVIAVCQVLVPEHCLLGEPPKHEKFVSFHKSSVEWWPFVTYPKPKDRGHHSPKPQDASVQGRLAYGQPQYQSAPLATAGDCRVSLLRQGKWNVSSIPSAPPAAAVRCLLFQLGWTGRWDSSPSLISGKRTFSESEAVSTEESVKELKETDESESTACAGASWTPQSLGSLNLWKHRVQWKRSAASKS